MSDKAHAEHSTKDLAPTRPSLVGRLKDWSDEASWHEFHKTYHRLIRRTALQAGLSETDADEVVQETIVSTAKAMPGFRYDPEVCSFKGWLRYLTRCRIADHLRKQERRLPVAEPDPQPTGGTGLLERQPDPESMSSTKEWDQEWERNLFEVALDGVRNRVKPIHFQVFQLCAIKGEKPQQVARDLDINLARVYLIRHRVTSALRKQIASLKKQWE